MTWLHGHPMVELGTSILAFSILVATVVFYVVASHEERRSSRIN
jgi:hypothetical protein